MPEPTRAAAFSVPAHTCFDRLGMPGLRRPHLVTGLHEPAQGACNYRVETVDYDCRVHCVHDDKRFHGVRRDRKLNKEYRQPKQRSLKQTSMDKAEKTATIKKFARSENDVGSVEVQVAVLSARIGELTEHLKVHRKDHASRRGLMAMVNRRRRLLRYLDREDHQRYQVLVKSLKLRR